jgi:hypothetical protein
MSDIFAVIAILAIGGGVIYLAASTNHGDEE